MSSSTDAELSLTNILRPEIRANPYPLYQRIRSEDPVHWDAPMGFWVLTRYEDVVAALHEARFSKASGLTTAQNRLPEEEREIAAPIYRSFSRQMLYADPPYHSQLRGLFNKAFTPRVVEKLRPHIQQIADELLDAVQARGEMDVIRDYAYPLPLTVIAELLGLSNTQCSQLKKWSDDIAAAMGIVRRDSEVLRQANQSLGEFTAYINEMYKERQAHPQDDLLTALVEVVEQGNRLDHEEFAANVLVVLIGGHETTTNLIGNGLLALLENKEQLDELRANPLLVESVVDEVLRYDSSVQIVWRIATEDVELGGKRIGKGQLVNVMLGAANRDPEQFPEPDRFDIHRPEHRIASFGFGVHYCVGSPLGRLDAEIALGTLVRRMTTLRLKSNGLDWQEAPTFRGVKALPIVF